MMLMFLVNQEIFFDCCDERRPWIFLRFPSIIICFFFLRPRAVAPCCWLRTKRAGCSIFSFHHHDHPDPSLVALAATLLPSVLAPVFFLGNDAY